MELKIENVKLKTTFLQSLKTLCPDNTAELRNIELQ